MSYSLALMSRFKPERFRLGSTAWMRWMAEVQGWTNRARTQHMDEIRHDAKAIEAFLADHGSSFGEQLWQEVDRWGSTTHISTWDAEGNTASITTSVGQGAGYLIPGTDIMINNMLGEADLNPDGFHRWKPDTRISSMMSPSIYEQKREGLFKPALVLGTGGANRIRTAILQVLHARIDHGLPIEEAVLAPRMHLEGDSLEVEGGFDPDEIQALPRHEAYFVRSWTDRNMFFGGVHAIALEGDCPQGAADTRRDGLVISV
jgi:gamma-glutamyltranspeptidase/glutathione hydrolase